MFLETIFDNPVLFLRIVLILILSITLHELAHGIAAISQGDDTPQQSGHLTLNPVVHMGVPSLIFLCLAGIAWGQMPVNPSKFRHEKWSNIIVSAAGPLMNLLIALICIGLLKVSSETGIRQILSTEFLYLAALYNLVLMIFNFLPIPPLDGFHVFSEFFPRLKPLQNSPWGFAILMILFVSPVFSSGLWLTARWMIESLSG
ncbi:MAG TPA: site-2 protease family protein [Leptolyngbyaceae cyanobacterium M33_DOE_097]|uniref:Site-2 protease family protein n=1 Tax=Oscillatoriales cyanobacterium SpSt-418 TaxID=2282169 RepID=A0A7C3PTD0_9CYAN|nr:site-2 protease family protein [Leptolyngbyaceae cyanobacterium M33_DOE_097]